MMEFDLPKELSSFIKVIGVGGGGSNAVNHMFRQGIKGVDFIVCNTDKQALDNSPVPVKIQLGKTLTQGLGAGMLPEVGRNAAIETIDEIKKLLKGTKMIFITAGMGKGTGTGAAPVIAQAAREMGILSVGIVTIPFWFEGAKKRAQAEAGIEELKKSVDTLLIICNERLREIYGNLTVVNAFSHADNVLSNAARSIAEIISNTLHVNVDFNDISTVMKDSGVAVLGTASASGEGRSINAVEMALNSPLLNDNEIAGARYVLMNVTSGADEITMDELGEITDYIQNAAGQTAEIVTGFGVDPNLGDKVNVTIIATGFKSRSIEGYDATKRAEKKVLKLDDDIIKQTEEVSTVAEISPEAQTKVDELEPVLKSELIAETTPAVVSQEIKPEEISTDPLEPVLVIRTAEELEDHTNDTEETVIVDEPEMIVEPVVEESILPVSELSPVVEVKEEMLEEIVPVAEESVAEVTVTETEIKMEEVIEPVPVQEEISFEIETAPEAVIEFTLTEEPSPEVKNEEPVQSDFVGETNEEIVPEVFEPVADLSSETTVKEEVKLEEQAVIEEPVVVNEQAELPVAETMVEPVINEIVEEPVMENKIEPVADIHPVENTTTETPEKKEEPVMEEPMLIKNRKEAVEEKKMETFPISQKVTDEEQRKKAQERILRLKELSLKLKSPNGLAELENEPAYKRKNINLESTPHSSESQVSKYTLTENEEKKVEIKPNNSFLHDNVD